jgi:hypothetical protein
MRWMDETGSIPTQVIPEWLASIIGQEVLDEMLENGATWNQLEELLTWLLENITYNKVMKKLKPKLPKRMAPQNSV